MKYLKTLGLAVLAVAAVMALAGTASATTLTSPAGTTLGVGAELKASAEKPFQVHTPIETRTCDNSQWTGKVIQKGGASETVVVELTNLTLDLCTSGYTFFVLKPGKLEIHTDSASADGNGIVTWAGGSFTTLTHTIVGDFHCKYHISNATLGTLKGSKNLAGGTATLDVGSVQLIPDEPYPWWYYCSEEIDGKEVGPVLTGGSYTIGTPDYLDVD